MRSEAAVEVAVVGAPAEAGDVEVEGVGDVEVDAEARGAVTSTPQTCNG